MHFIFSKQLLSLSLLPQLFQGHRCSCNKLHSTGKGLFQSSYKAISSRSPRKIFLFNAKRTEVRGKMILPLESINHFSYWVSLHRRQKSYTTQHTLWKPYQEGFPVVSHSTTWPSRDIAEGKLVNNLSAAVDMRHCRILSLAIAPHY